jgi:signal transduction histidine kinase
MLVLLAEVTRKLHDGRSLAARMGDVFTLLHRGVPFRDARLTCWLQSAQRGATRQQFSSPDSTDDAWDDSLMRQAGLAQQMLRRVLRGAATTGGEAALIYLGVPVMWGGRLWGVLEFRALGNEALAATDQEVIQTLVPQLAMAIAAEGVRHQQSTPPNVQSLPLTQPDQQRDLFLHALEHELEQLLDLQGLLTLLLHRMLDKTAAEAGAICLVDHERSELVVHVSEGYPPDLVAGGAQRQRWRWDSGLAGRIARSGRALLVRDVTQEHDIQPLAAHLRAEMAAPIMGNGQVLAVIVLNSSCPTAFGDADLALINTLCERVAQPLQRVLRYQELLETNAQLTEVFSSLPTGMALINTSGVVLRTNEAWAICWGMVNQPQKRPFRVPRDLVLLLRPRLADPAHLTEFWASGLHVPGEQHMINIVLTNPTQELQLLSAPTRDSMGQVTGRLWMVHDVTHEREVDRLKSEFISIVSHELRTPLTSILGYTELLLARKFAPHEQREFIETIYGQAAHLSKLVDDLLDTSRIESGRMKLNCWMVALRQVISEMANQLAHLKHHRLLIRMAGHLPPVYIDRDKIKQVLFNLITNAIKYSPQGGEIELAVQEDGALPAEHPPGRWLIVSVRDQGIGIASEDLDRIWERFYRVDNTNTRSIGGTGLGLSIARGLVELHGGRIWAESVLDEGSTFSFTLPVATDIAKLDTETD